MRRQRVAIDASAAWTGGGLSRVRELLSAFRLLAPANEYILVATEKLVSHLDDFRDVTLQTVPRGLSPPPLRMFWQQMLLPYLLRGEKVDWILSPFNVLPLGPGLPHRVRCAVIVSSIAPFSMEFTSSVAGYQAMRLRLLKELTHRSLTVADKVFLLSNEARNLLADTVRDQDVVMLPMSPPPPNVMDAAARIRFSSELVGGHFFLIVGDLLPHKGHEDAIRAVSLLREWGAAVRLLIVGRSLDPRYLAKLRALADGVRPPSVAFLGALEHVDVLALMRASTGTVIPSRIENTSRVPVEAMASGSPIVAADISNLRETCGAAATYFGVGNHEALADRMRQLLDSRSRAELAAKGRARMHGNDWLSASRLILQAMELQ